MVKKCRDQGSQSRDEGSGSLELGIWLTFKDGVRHQNSHRIWDQGSTFWLKYGISYGKITPRYDPDFRPLGQKIPFLAM